MSDEDNRLEEQIYSQIFAQLLESERFQRFIQVNYDIQKLVDEEEKTIEYRVIELPPVLAEQRLAELVKEKGKEDSAIVSANMQDLKRIEDFLEKEDN